MLVMQWRNDLSRNKQMQKECKTRHDWVGKVIQWELCKKLKFDHSIKWYVHKTESLMEIKKPKIGREF